MILVEASASGYPRASSSPADKMLAHAFMRGLRIVFDQALDPETVDSATCFVTLDIPWPLTGEDRDRLDMKRVVGGWPLILRSALEPGENELLWRPEDEETIFALLGILSTAARRVPAHLTLKRNFIKARGERGVYLDGDVFGNSQEDLGMRLPSPEGRRGGDFEMYLWLITEEIG